MNMTVYMCIGLTAALCCAVVLPSCPPTMAAPSANAAGSIGPLPYPDLAKQRPGAEFHGYLLKANLQQAEVAPASQVVLDITLRNVGKQDIDIGVSYPPANDYVVLVQTPTGERHWYGSTSQIRFYSQSCTLVPGSERTDGYIVSDKFQFSVPGKYRLTAARMVHGDVKHVRTYVVSNTVTLTVAKAKHVQPGRQVDGSQQNAAPSGGFGQPF